MSKKSILRTKAEKSTLRARGKKSILRTTTKNDDSPTVPVVLTEKSVPKFFVFIRKTARN